jgi:hypothetical protein
MNKIIYLVLIFMLLWCACDPELFKQKQAPQIISVTSDKGFRINPGDTITLTVEATNPEEGDLTYSWDAPASFLFLSGRDAESVVLKAPFAGGTYPVKVTVSNADKSSERSVDVVVKSMTAPYVRIIQPSEDDFWVQYTKNQIQAEAIHENGIFRAWLIVNDTLEISQNPQIQGDIYTFFWNTDIAYGQAELKVVAEATTGVQGADSVRVFIEGVIPGKNEKNR